MHRRESTLPNISATADRQTLKWTDLVKPNVPLPTTPEDVLNLAGMDGHGNGGVVVGALEGGGYCTKGLFRPELSCLMRSDGEPFCAVCRRERDKFFAKLAK